MTTIPLSSFDSVQPGVISGGGAALDLIGLVLTNNAYVPVGQAMAFPSQQAVAAFFGQASTEAEMAAVYFNGFVGSTKTPGSLLFYFYNTSPVGAYLRGGSMAGVTLAQLQSYTGGVGVVIDGTTKGVGSISLAAATSFTSAAAILASACACSVTYDTVHQAFVFASATTGAASTITFASGTLCPLLNLTQATGAVTSQGAVASNPASAMAGVLAATHDWALFTTAFEPVTADKLSFSQWVSGQDYEFGYVPWDSLDGDAITNTADPTQFVAQLLAAGYSGVCPVYEDPYAAMLVLGWAASLDFDRLNGRATLDFASSTLVTPSVTTAQAAADLKANGYNFYGAFGSAAQEFQFFTDGHVTGPFEWMDSFVNQIWLNSGLQAAAATLLTQIKRIPYNDAGVSYIKAAYQDPIDAAVNFGAITVGVALSNLQAAEVNGQAGLAIDQTLTAKGYYLQVILPPSNVRQERGTPVCTLWYMDGESVQSLNLASLLVQ
jgi:hypothetical protein